MNAVSELRDHYLLLKLGIGSPQDCIQWAIERLQSDQENNDLDIVLLAAASERDEIFPLVETIIVRYMGLPSPNDEQSAVGRYIALLHHDYLAGKETVRSLDSKLWKLYSKLDNPYWMAILCRNSEFATDTQCFLEPFKQELEYIANLWKNSRTLDEFESRYGREISDQHAGSFTGLYDISRRSKAPDKVKKLPFFARREGLLQILIRDDTMYVQQTIAKFGMKVIREVKGPLDWLWFVEYKGSKFILAYIDFPEEFAIMADTIADEAALRELGTAMGATGMDEVG